MINNEKNKNDNDNKELNDRINEKKNLISKYRNDYREIISRQEQLNNDYRKLDNLIDSLHDSFSGGTAERTISNMKEMYNQDNKRNNNIFDKKKDSLNLLIRNNENDLTELENNKRRNDNNGKD